MGLWELQTVDVTTALIFLLTLCLVYLNTRRSPLVPPGPALWPVIGNLLVLAGNPIDKLGKLRRKYGDVVGLYLGRELTVFVSGHDAIQEVLVKRGSKFSWRPETTFMERVIQTKSIVFANGSLWKENRNFTQIAFQKLCLTNRSLGIEEKITDELSFFVTKLSTLTEPVDIGRDLNLSTANVIYSILHGHRCGYDDPRIHWYLNILQVAFTNFRNHQLLTDCFPFLLHLPFDVIGVDQLYRKVEIALEKHFQELCGENFDTYVEGREDCLVHHLITATGTTDMRAFERLLSDGKCGWAILHDLMAAGSETTATTIRWILLYLIQDPEVQRKAADEVDRLIGRDSAPSVRHRCGSGCS